MAKVSICVPTYNNPTDVDRLLKSVMTQTYTDYEVLISDDSTDDKVCSVVEKYKADPDFGSDIKYIHNRKPLGHVYNWNAAIKMATGDYIKIMFSDDWFTFNDSLEKLVNMLDTNPECDLAFSSSRQVILDGNELKNLQHVTREHAVTSYDRVLEDGYIDNLRKDYRYMFISNQIGAPSDSIYRRGANLILFDEKSGWASDNFLYMEILSHNPEFVDTPEPLISIGIHGNQYTEGFSDKDIRVYNDYRYMFIKYNLKDSYMCRKHMAENFIVKWHKGPSEALELGIELPLYFKMAIKEFGLAIKCFTSSRIKRILKTDSK
ncbi:MAG: glycosyltransferase [Butyrivibrio sp.]|nr:glycosyltransferase [Butyrivibrio sp.]